MSQDLWDRRVLKESPELKELKAFKDSKVILGSKALRGRLALRVPRDRKVSLAHRASLD